MKPSTPTPAAAPLKEQNFLQDFPVISYLNRNISYPRSEWPKSWKPPTQPIPLNTNEKKTILSEKKKESELVVGK
jgi:hypothetical protein